LTALPLTGETAKQADSWIAAIVDGEQSGELIWDGDELLGAGYEFQRSLQVDEAVVTIRWDERVLVVRSASLARQQAQGLEERLLRAEKELLGLTPAPGRGERQISDEEALRTAIDQILQRHQVAGLLEMAWQREENNVTRLVGPGRSGPNRPMHNEVQIRYQITAVQRLDVAIQSRKHRQGWRFYVTNLPTTRRNLAQAAIHYRGG
jgi:transposase